MLMRLLYPVTPKYLHLLGVDAGIVGTLEHLPSLIASNCLSRAHSSNLEQYHQCIRGTNVQESTSR